jgi:CheY-specific phosphatase CheX
MQAIAPNYESEIHQAVQELFSTMLNTEVTPAEQCEKTGLDMITAIIAFAGPWKGDLVLECGRPQALAFAQRFLQSDELDSFSEDIISPVAELANIIAGNLKVVLPQGVTISTPSVVQGDRYDIRIYGSTLVNRCVFVTDAGPFEVRLIRACQPGKESHEHSDRG